MAQVVHKVSPAVVRGRIHASPEEIAAFCRAHHIQWLALFGSVLRDDFRDDSDIDVLIELNPEHPATFFDLHDMKEKLSRLFGGREVEIVTRAALYWRMRDRILRSMIVLHGDAPEIPDAAASDLSTPKDDRVYVGIMWDMARTMHDAVCGKTRAQYAADTMLRHALAEALRRLSARSVQVSDVFRAAHREVAWDETDAMYRAISEDSIAIDEGILWDIAARAMPALIPLLENLLPRRCATRWVGDHEAWMAEGRGRPRCQAYKRRVEEPPRLAATVPARDAARYTEPGPTSPGEGCERSTP